MASELDIRIGVSIQTPDIGIGVARDVPNVGISVAMETPNIGISVNRSIPDIGLNVDRRWKTISFEINKGGEYHLPYPGPYVVDASFYFDRILRTNGRVMNDNVTVNRIPVLEASNPQGGKTITIGV